MKAAKHLLGVLCVAAALGVVVGGASAERVKVGKLILKVDGVFIPSILPKRGFAPMRLKGYATIRNSDRTPPAPLQELKLKIDRNVKIRTKGLAVCDPASLADATARTARRVCRDAVVGAGLGSARVFHPDQEPFPVTAPITVLNGPPVDGDPTAIFHAAYATKPTPTTVIAVARITRLKHGRFRYQITSEIPVIFEGYASLTHVDLRLGRNYIVGGRKVPYLSARCPDGQLQARGRFTFGDGTIIAGTIFRPCRIEE
jgi:hypothetical protein